MSKYGFSEWHDKTLNWCRAHLQFCPFNCAQDGAPNCWGNCIEFRCEPSRQFPYYNTPLGEALGAKIVEARQAPLDWDEVDKELGR
jgi:hypothetical protein